jgi:SNF2 family DNA or RNA helicase
MLRDYQIEIAEKSAEILIGLKIVYLAIEMRVGKTLIALQSAKILNAKNVLFVTKKKAIDSIMSDYVREGFDFNLTVINYEQVKKYVKQKFDIVIIDEAHLLGQFPKPSLRTKMLKSVVKDNYLMLLSGTPSPESYSQLFHQFWISDNSPFEHKNFYHWSKEFVNVKMKILRGLRINDYSDGDRLNIMKYLNKYMITYTRKQAGFEIADVDEELIPVKIDPRIYILTDILLRDKYYKFRDNAEIIADVPVKLLTKIHQLHSGTIITDDGTSKVLDLSKANYILANYENKKTAVFYKFKAERDALISVFKSELTESIEEFNANKKRVFISQIQSGSMGTNLSSADVLIFYNIDFSAVQYWQARARLQTLDRIEKAVVHWLFSEEGIEGKIYEAVKKKKNYTQQYFMRDYAIKNNKVLAI